MRLRPVRAREDPLVRWAASLLQPLAARARRSTIERTVASIRSVRRDLPSDSAWEPNHREVLWLLESLADTAFDLRRRQRDDGRRFEEFSTLYFRVDEAEARRRVAEEYLRATVTDSATLRGDIRALRRHLDHEALHERNQRHLHGLGQQIELCLQLIQFSTEDLERKGFELEGGEGSLTRFVVEFLGLVPFLLELVDEPGRWQTRVSAFKTLCFLVERAMGGDSPLDIEPDTLRSIVVAAQNPHANLHIQRDATRLILLIDPEEGTGILERRLLRDKDDLPRDDFLYRATAVRLVVETFETSRAIELLRAVLLHDDPSEHVRLTLVRVLGRFDLPETDEMLASLAAGGDLTDPVPRVRAVVIESWSAILSRALGVLERRSDEALPRARRALEALCQAVDGDVEDLPQRVAIEEGGEGIAAVFGAAGGVVPAPLHEVVMALLAALARRARGEDTSPRNAMVAARQLVRLRPLLDPEIARWYGDLRFRLESVSPGGTATVSLPDGPGWREPGFWGPLLVAAGADDLGLSVVPRRDALRVQRGPRQKPALWRFLHEIRHRAPDKRQAVVHTGAAAALGRFRAPPLGMAAITPTTVPGEPVVSPVLGSWGPGVPTVGDCLDAVRSGRPVVLFHPHGTTEIEPPSGMRRTTAVWKLRWHFARYDALRQRCLGAIDQPERPRFVEALRELGFELTYRPAHLEHGGAVLDLESHDLPQFFPSRPGAAALPAAVGLPSLDAVLDQTWNYTVSTGGNSLTHLGAFLGALGVVVIGDAVIQAARIRSWRRTVPLVVGGWGTRGKSGTERLKAALFHALGYEVLSKTTGCEAMVIHSAPGITPREIFLYRPYDKASIWEQRDVLRLASRMGVQVMLWECMALNPRFVEILSLEWMKDDLATVTNCYPDHEDLQGPAGRDVAETISRFVPRDTVVLTSELEMTPILRQRAKEQRSRCVPVADRTAELIPSDLLARFPYREHPRNIALVARMAEEFGIDQEFAIVAMADHVVPDVGSLKIFPTTSYRGRRFIYINGHSANERTGFLNNWNRTGMGDFDPLANRGTWAGGVINNRDDRVPRSRVFAAIVAGDVAAHVLVLIGTNLNGFTGYLRQSLGEVMAGFQLDQDADLSQERFRRLMARLHLRRWDAGYLAWEIGSWLEGCGLSESEAQRRLVEVRLEERSGALIGSLSFEPGQECLSHALDAIRGSSELETSLQQLCAGVTGDGRDAELLVFARRQMALVATAAAAARAVDGDEAPGDLTPRLRKLFVDLMMERLRPLANASAKGDQVLDFLAGQFPPGVLARVLGMQNIKGTGLDFVYRWVSYDQVHAVIGRLEGAGRRESIEGLRWLSQHPDYGVMDARFAVESVERLLRTRFHEWNDVAHEAELLLYVLRDKAAAKEEAIRRTEARMSLRKALATVVERGLDYLHSVVRRRSADRIYEELVHQRISHARAAALMRELTSVQKGGWLTR